MVITIPKIYAEAYYYEVWSGDGSGKVQTPYGEIHPFAEWEGGVRCAPNRPYEPVDGTWVDKKTFFPDSVWGSFSGKRNTETGEVTGTWVIEGGTIDVPVGEGGGFSGIWPRGGGQVQDGVWWCTGSLTGNGEYYGNGVPVRECD